MTTVRKTSGPVVPQTSSGATAQSRAASTASEPQGYDLKSAFESATDQASTHLREYREKMKFTFIGEDWYAGITRSAESKMQELVNRSPPASPEEFGKELTTICDQAKAKAFVDEQFMKMMFENMNARYKQLMEEAKRNWQEE